MQYESQRRFPRVSTILRVQYEGLQNPFSDYITCLGGGGIFIRTEMPFAVGQKLELSLSFPGLLDPLPLTGTVRWRRDDDEPGVGVEFELSDGGLPDDLSRILPGESAEPSFDGSKLRILLVEENLLANEFFRHAIDSHSAEVGLAAAVEIHSARSAYDVLILLAEESFDLMLIDCALPEMSGIELIRRIRETDRMSRTPIVALSAEGNSLREQALGVGADLFIDKAYLADQLIGTLKMLLAQRKKVSGGRIIVIDDNEVVLQATKYALEHVGYEVLVLTDPTKFDPRSEKPDLIIVDVHMPQYYGDDMVAFFKEELPVSVPILLHSSLGETELALRAQACGADGFVSKQSGMQQLVSEIGRQLDARTE